MRVIEMDRKLSQRKGTPLDKGSNTFPAPALTPLAHRGARGQTCLVWGQPGLELSQLGGS